MHYRNGREAKNGDKVVRFDSEGKIEAFGYLVDAQPDGDSYCNGNIINPNGSGVTYACLCDCLHVDDLAGILKENGLDKRPEGM